MNVGDLVRLESLPFTAGIVIETGLEAGSLYVKVMWEDATIFTERIRSLELISEDR